MVAPVVAGGLIKGAFGLLGGLFGKKSAAKAQAQQNWYNAPKQQVARWLEAGINPLWGISNGASGNQQGTGYTPIMGNAIAQAGAAYADGKQAEQQLEIQRAELEMENERLDALVKATKLTENVGGIYNHASNTQSNSDTDTDRSPIGDDSGLTSVRVAGYDVNPHTGFSDAETAEQRYGEVGGAVYGLGVIGADTVSNLAPHVRRAANRMGRMVQPYAEQFNPNRRRIPSTPKPETVERDPDAKYYNSFQTVIPQTERRKYSIFMGKRNLSAY